MQELTGYMIYHAAEGQKNNAFVSMFQHAGEAKGLQFQLVTRERYRQLPDPDFVLNRTRDAKVSQYYQQKKIPVFHEADIVETGNDKWKTLQLAKRYWKDSLEGKIPDTLFLPKSCDRTEKQTIQQITEWHTKRIKECDRSGRKQDVVIKTVDGHGGSEVCLLSSERSSNTTEALCELLQTKYPHRDILCQQWIDSDSKDIRVYVVAGQIYAAVCRQGEHDFRSNFSLGGKVSEYQLSESQKSLIGRWIDCLGGEKLAMAGIDFLPDRDGSLVFNELEEMVGSRMLYFCTDLDIVRDYTAWLAEALRKSIV